MPVNPTANKPLHQFKPLKKKPAPAQDQGPGLWKPSTSLHIRRMLSTSENYPYELWQALKIKREQFNPAAKVGSYQTFRVTIWILKQLGLIKLVRTQRVRSPDGKRPIDRHYYTVVRERINDPAWENPRKALYPESYKE